MPGVDELTRVNLLTQAALLWREEGDNDAAFGALDTAVKYRATPRVLIERAILHADARAWEKAHSDLSQALSTSPRDAEALSLRAAANRRMGDAEAARRDAMLAIEYLPVSPAAWFELGKAEQALGLSDGARKVVVENHRCRARQSVCNTGARRPSGYGWGWVMGVITHYPLSNSA